MKPSTKTPEMEAALTNLFGYDRRTSIEAGRCAPPSVGGCGGVATVFRDSLSEREFTISGLCQKCQDRVFSCDGGEDDEEHDYIEAITSPPPPKPPEPIVGPNDYRVLSGGMKCGQSEEAQSRRYRKVECKHGVWLIALQEAAAENVYFHDPRDTNSQGFGGATLHFELEDGTVYAAKGPWHGNADSLYKDTGVDVRNTHYTFVVLAMKCDFVTWDDTIFRDVVYRDEKPVLGSFYRYRELIRQYPQALVYYSESSGGSSSGPISEQDRKEVQP